MAATEDLKNELCNAAIEAAVASKNATNLAVTKAGDGDYVAAGNVAATGAQVGALARDLANALAAVETAFPATP